MKNRVHWSRWRDAIKEHFTSPSIYLILALLVAFSLGVVLDELSPVYDLAVAGALGVMIMVQLRLDGLAVALIVAVHILVDTYLGFGVYQLALLMALLLLVACYFGRSTDHPFTGPRSIWLWALFLILNIYPTMNGGTFGLPNAIAFYLNVVLGAFIMFWLGNLIAKNMSAMRGVLQLLSVLAVLIAIHTIIEAITGKFLFETARAEALLVQYSNFQAEGASGVIRFGSFLINPDGNGEFLAVCFFLL